MLGCNDGTWCHRQATKRRCSSPRYFPRKVHISEEKVAEELGNLSIGMSCDRTYSNFADSRANFFVGKTKQRTFQEIEDSLDLDDEALDVNRTRIELAPELVSEIKKLKRKILVPGTYRPLKKIPESCTELVLWRPPSGTVQQIMNLVNNLDSEPEGQQEGEPNHTDHCTNTSMQLDGASYVKTIPNEISTERQSTEFAPPRQSDVAHAYSHTFTVPSASTSVKCLAGEKQQYSPYFKPVRDSDFGSFCKRDFDDCEMEL